MRSIAELITGKSRHEIELLPENHPERIRFEVTEELFDKEGGENDTRNSRCG